MCLFTFSGSKQNSNMKNVIRLKMYFHKRFWCYNTIFRVYKSTDSKNVDKLKKLLAASNRKSTNVREEKSSLKSTRKIKKTNLPLFKSLEKLDSSDPNEFGRNFKSSVIASSIISSGQKAKAKNMESLISDLKIQTVEEPALEFQFEKGENSAPDPKLFEIPLELQDKNMNKVITYDLLKQLTPEFTRKIVQDISIKQIRLENLKKVIKEMYEFDFPFPKTFTEKQWSRLLSLDGTKAKIYYIFAIVDDLEDDKYTLNQIEEMVMKTTGPVKAFDSNYLDSVMKKNPDFEFIWEMIKGQVEELHFDGNFDEPALTNSDIAMFVNLSLDAKSQHLGNSISSTLTKIQLNRKDTLMQAVKLKGQSVKKSSHFPSREHFIPPCNIDNWYEEQFLLKSQWSEPIYVDLFHCDFNTSAMYKAMRSSLFVNCYAPQPFDLVFTNSRHLSSRHRLRHNQHTHWVDYHFQCNMLCFTRYLETKKKKNLVYITPYSDNELTYHPEDIYVIGSESTAEVKDISGGKFDQIKKRNMRHAKLPLEKYKG